MGYGYIGLTGLEKPESFIRDAEHPIVRLALDLQTREACERTGLAFIQGSRLFVSLTRKQADVEFMVWSPELSARSSFVNEMILRQKREVGTPCYAVSRDVFRGICYDVGRRDYVAAIFRQRWRSLSDVVAAGEGRWVALAGDEDAHAVGTVLRTMDAVGAHGLILLTESIDVHDPCCLEASMGAVFSQKLARCAWDAFFEWKRDSRMVVVGLETTQCSSTHFQAACYARHMVFLINHTDLPLPPLLQAMCNKTVHIPVCPQLHFNRGPDTATAVALLLYEASRERRRPGQTEITSE
ncbi:MAG: hypothetical protein GX605_06155 [Chloroflexi bacterium]|nr:hypothetical protein [Chloroflexota bacterium]